MSILINDEWKKEKKGKKIWFQRKKNEDNRKEHFKEWMKKNERKPISNQASETINEFNEIWNKTTK